MRPLLLALALPFALVSCDSVAESTYPGALDLPEVAPAALLQADAGRYNTVAVVAEVYVCPPEADCAAAGAITLADRVTGEEPAAPAPRVWVDAPAQFGVGDRGRFSVRVGGTPGGTDDSLGFQLLTTLLGYDRL